jgi:hypothetical protein
VDVCPKSLNSIYGSHGPLGDREQGLFQWSDLALISQKKKL